MAAGDKLVVAGDGVNLRAGPSESAPVVGNYPKGTRVTEVGVQGEWTQVIVADPLGGYMASRFLAPEPAPTQDYLGKVSLEHVTPMFPQTPRGNIQANLPHVAAGLRAKNLDDRQMLLMALGTIRAETAGFVPIPEGKSKFNTAPGGAPFGLYEPGTGPGKRVGNTEPGDGARFKGRGFVQLTGRDNYGRVGSQLKIDLLGNPDLACDGPTAGLILAQFLLNNEQKIRSALAKNDLALARKLVNGGSNGLPDFTEAYNKGLATLPT